MVEAVPADGQRPAVGIDDGQRTAGLDAADAADGRARRTRGGAHGIVLMRGGGEQQLVVVAAVQQAFLLQRWRQRGQIGAARQCGQFHACADRGALQDAPPLFFQ